MSILIIFLSLFLILYSVNTNSSSKDVIFYNFPIFKINSRKHYNTYENINKKNLINEQENHFLAYKNALKLLTEVPRNDSEYEERKSIEVKQNNNLLFNNDFNIKFNRLNTMKIFKKMFFENYCLDKYSMCKLWKNNDFCHNTFYSKTYRNHICPKSCGLC
uniref:ShKT domain-containing protein n=1 Tax=Strongyloides stercoralis TaxID=6248 RepID=A0AAF5DDF8_STRER